MAVHVSTKTYGHEVGLSCCFRQWRSVHSHCQYLHGYAIAVRLEFESTELDERNWVIDFGGLKTFKQRLQELFDHKTIIAQDDPELSWFKQAEARGLIQLVTVAAVGCESFAKLVYEEACQWLESAGYTPRCRVSSVEVREHGANSALYKP